jgi:isopenicillin N synthase-like dioxygenase
MTSSNLDASIPLLSLTSLSVPDFADRIGRSFREYGFAMVSDHGIAADLIAQGWSLSRQFFALSEAEKRHYHIPGLAGQRGYTPFATEIAKGANHKDLKEFWHVGRDFPIGDPLESMIPRNIWPDEVSHFRACFSALFDALDKAGKQILSAIALHLGLDPHWFDPAVRDGNSILRLLHYPPVIGPTPAVRAGAHEDINLITLLLGAEESGLELLRRDGTWLSISPPEGALVINIGDMLQRLTNHVLPSTTHRVVNPAPERASHSRYSMPFFMHLRPDFLITPLPQCVSTTNLACEPPIMAGDYLAERLREIGLMRG